MPNLTPAQRLAARIHAGWNLGNTLDAIKRDVKSGEIVSPREAETAWNNPPVTKSLIHAVQDAGFDAVRLPVTWVQHLDCDGRIDPAWLDRVEEITGWILDAGMVCMLNVHHDAGSHGWLQATGMCHERYGERFEYLWRQIAERFVGTGEKLVFEAFNEMLDGKEHWSETMDDDAYSAHNRWHQRFVDAVRACGGYNAARILSLQSYSAGHTPRTLNAFRMPADTDTGRIILQVHNYDPQGFCWLRSDTHPLRDTWGTDADHAQIDALMTALSAFAAKHGAPLMIGEFGSEDKQNTAARARHAACFTEKAREQGIPCFWWDCGRFALMDRHTGKVLHREIVDALCRS